MRRSPGITELPRYPVTAGTAMLAIGITIAWWAKMDFSSLFESAMIRRGELWRLVTCIFPHLNIWHLAFNVYWLWVFGTLIEQVYGHLRTVALILLFAIGSSAFEFAFSSGGVGLSGVGYGLFGLLWILSKRDERFRDAIDERTIQLFDVWFFICIFTTVTKIIPVANIAHGAGAALGVSDGIRAYSAAPSPFHPCRAWHGFDALTQDRNREAVQWFREAVIYRPKTHEFWYDLGIANQRFGDQPGAMAAHRQAADLGDSSAQSYLGSIYDSGGQGLPKDGAQAVYWYRRAADQGDPGAQQSCLGLCHQYRSCDP
jgi:membrane associated rhomboid family serine protease